MRLRIEIELDNAAFEDDLGFELDRILDTVKYKVMVQLSRADGVLCNVLEIDDKLLDINGNTVGTVKLSNFRRPSFTEDYPQR